MSQVSTYERYYNTDAPHDVNYKTILRYVKEGRWSDLVQKVRKEKDEEKRKELKKGLPATSFSGTFTARKNEALVNHSGLICLDFDKVKDVEEKKRELIADEYIHACWVSPSGNGLKALIKIRREDHYGSFLALKEQYPDIDDACKDVSRLCFASYDPKLYLNEGSKIWIKQKKHKEKKTVNQGGLFEPLKEGSRNQQLIRAAGKLIAYSSLNQSDIYQLLVNLNNASENPLPEDEFRQTLENAFGYDEREYTEDKLDEILLGSHVDLLVDLPAPPIVMSVLNWDKEWKQQRLFTAGNISSTTGKAKSKKSMLTAVFMAAASSNATICSKMTGHLPEGKNMAVLFDTEQASYDSQVLGKKILELGGGINNVNVFCLREYSNKDRIRIIERALEKYGERIGFMVIDGVADLVNSINDEEEAGKAVQKLMKWSKQYNIHIHNVIHQNKADSYATGHLGSAILKKSEAIISVEKNESDPNTSTVKCQLIRGVKHFDNFEIYITDEGKIKLSNEFRQDEDLEENPPF